jgi:hypothetical protein
MENKDTFKNGRDNKKPFVGKHERKQSDSGKTFKCQAGNKPFSKECKPKYDFVQYLLVFAGSRVTLSGYKNARNIYDGFESGCTLYGVKPNGSLKELAKK